MTGKLRGAHVENVEGVPKVEVDWMGGEMGKAERELVRESEQEPRRKLQCTVFILKSCLFQETKQTPTCALLSVQAS